VPKSPPNKVVVLVDDREKKPILFPKTIEWFSERGGEGHLIQVVTKKVRLPEGDYALKGYDDVAIIERKGSLEEIAQNMLTGDYARATSAFQRLVEACEFPYLLIDCPINKLFDSPWVEQPDRAIQALFQFAAEKGLRILVGGHSIRPVARRQLGKLCLTLLLTHAMIEPCGPIDILSLMENL